MRGITSGVSVNGESLEMSGPPSWKCLEFSGSCKCFFQARVEDSIPGLKHAHAIKTKPIFLFFGALLYRSGQLKSLREEIT